MKKSNLIKKRTIVGIFGLFMVFSCTDFTEDTYGVVTTDTFFQNEEESLTGLVPVYASIRPLFTDSSFLGVSEVTSDATIVPSRPGWGWEDGGVWISLSEHAWTAQNVHLIGFYNHAFTSIALANSFISNIEDSEAEFPTKPQLIAEARFLRAYSYMVLLDSWGNVPLVTEPLKDSDQPSSNEGATNRPIVAQFIIDELNEVADLLPDSQTGENYGRVSKYAAKMLLARMYLNSNVYFETGAFSESDLDKAISLTTEVIDSGHYSLIDSYLSIFDIENELDNSEAVFVARFDNVTGAGNSINFISLNAHPSFEKIAPWGGFVVTADIVNSFDLNDERLGQIVVDSIFDENGDPFKTTNIISGNLEPIVHDRNLVDPIRTGFFEGARLLKWPEDPNQVGSNGGNDFIVVRYTEAYTMRAEAFLRMGDESNALNDINLVRERAFDPNEPLTSLNLESLLEELGREFVFEAHRRTDLIRFGKWTQPWQFKDNTDPTRSLYPIPQPELDTNPNLTQNPGY